MLINVFLYDNNSVIRIAERATKVFSDFLGYRVTSNTVWFNGMYLKFADKMLVLNVFNSNVVSEDEITEHLKKILLGEEVYISNNYQSEKYIEKVNDSTVFPVTSYEERL